VAGRCFHLASIVMNEYACLQTGLKSLVTSRCYASAALRPVYSDATQLNSTSSCRHVHSVNNSHRSVLNVVTQLTQFVGHDVIYGFCRATLCKRGLSRHAVSVCLSVCLSRSYILSKRINISPKFFASSGSHTILHFPYRTAWQYSDGNPSNGGVECRCGRQKSRF